MKATHRSFRMDPARYPIAVPHVSWSAGMLYFGGRAIRELPPPEEALLERCDGSRPLRDFASTPADARSIATFAPWLVWWDQPLGDGREPGPDTTRLVLSPGPEDAWLGMGGRLLIEAPTRTTTVITCFGLVGRTVEPLAFGTPNDLAAITRDEARLVTKLSGVAHDILAFPALELRPSADQRQGAAASVDWLKSMLREVLEETIARTQPAEIFAPVAVDPYSDAGVLLDVVLGMYVDGLLSDAELHLFESVPVARGHRPVDEFLSRFERSYVELGGYFITITSRIVHKASVLEVFRSRVDNASRDAWLESAQRNATIADRIDDGDHDAVEGQRAERFWTVRLAGAA